MGERQERSTSFGRSCRASPYPRFFFLSLELGGGPFRLSQGKSTAAGSLVRARRCRRVARRLIMEAIAGACKRFAGAEDTSSDMTAKALKSPLTSATPLPSFLAPCPSRCSPHRSSCTTRTDTRTCTASEVISSTIPVDSQEATHLYEQLF